MGMLAAFVFGYWLGTRSGQEGLSKLRNSTLAVLQSDEFHATVAGVAGMARGALQQGLAVAASNGERFTARAA